ncbi:AMP-binding protein [Micromonospora sp. WMMD1128]|uniref:class I adenylate-forming enzyme family protein n=1 Tax=Micromonospora sp. WMMD1128 TaxID=3015150 RepID=UPI00248AB7CB|nr:AMP-binding protein [Micromonospora sp. WMMD1128]WBB71312.1 AMP-binding protein [Micromonospora sp. WMMD1128]
MDRTAAESACPNYVMRILDSLASRPDEVVVKWRDQSITAGEFVRSTVAATRRMQELGIDRTHTVAALSASNSPTIIYTRYAAHLLGARLVHILSVNANSAAESLAESQQVDILNEVSATLLAVDVESLDVARRLRDAVKGPLKLATYGSDGAPVDADLSAGDTNDDGLPEPRPIVEGDTATIIYTSGTTGKPKGICRSYGSWHRETVGAMNQVKSMNLGPSGYLVTIPLSNAGISVDSVLAHEGVVLLHEQFDAGRVLETIERERVGGTFWATQHLYQILDHPRLNDVDTSSLRLVMYGGTPISPARIERAVERFGLIFVQYYGTTESRRISALTPADHRDKNLLASAGRPIPTVQLVIRDPETGADLDANVPGEVCVRTPGMMTEYFLDPVRTEKALRDGWFHTGDIGYFDDAGYLYLVDRLYHVVKTDGIKIYPAEIERVLLLHPAVTRASVIKVRDADLRDSICAYVQPRAAHGDLTSEELAEFVAEKMSPLHVPAVIELVSDLATTQFGKADAQALRQMRGA